MSCFVYGGAVMPGQRTGSDASNYNAERPNQGSKRFDYIKKTIHFAHLWRKTSLFPSNCALCSFF